MYGDDHPYPKRISYAAANLRHIANELDDEHCNLVELLKTPQAELVARLRQAERALQAYRACTTWNDDDTPDEEFKKLIDSLGGEDAIDGSPEGLYELSCLEYAKWRDLIGDPLDDDR